MMDCREIADAGFVDGLLVGLGLGAVLMLSVAGALLAMANWRWSLERR